MRPPFFLSFQMKSSPSSSEGALTSLRLDLPLNRRGPSSGFNGPGAQTHSGLGAAGYPEPHPIPATPSRTGTLGGGGGSAGQPAEGERKSASGMDEFLMHLGNPGRFQVVVMILLSTNLIPVVVNHLLMAFYAVSAPHNCRVRKTSHAWIMAKPISFLGRESIHIFL